MPYTTEERPLPLLSAATNDRQETRQLVLMLANRIPGAHAPTVEDFADMSNTKLQTLLRCLLLEEMWRDYAIRRIQRLELDVLSPISQVPRTRYDSLTSQQLRDYHDQLRVMLYNQGSPDGTPNITVAQLRGWDDVRRTSYP
jgi:hypothetical protein